MNFNDAFAVVIGHEGGYVNDQKARTINVCAHQTLPRQLSRLSTWRAKKRLQFSSLLKIRVLTSAAFLVAFVRHTQAAYVMHTTFVLAKGFPLTLLLEPESAKGNAAFVEQIAEQKVDGECAPLITEQGVDTPSSRVLSTCSEINALTAARNLIYLSMTFIILAAKKIAPQTFLVMVRQSKLEQSYPNVFCCAQTAID